MKDRPEMLGSVWIEDAPEGWNLCTNNTKFRNTGMMGWLVHPRSFERMHHEKKKERVTTD